MKKFLAILMVLAMGVVLVSVTGVAECDKHSFTGTVQYIWSHDHESCIAKGICSVCNEEVTEAAVVSYQSSFDSGYFWVSFSAIFDNTTLKNRSFSYGPDEFPHVLIEHDAVDPTCNEPGNKKYWSCDKCSLLFSDAGFTQIEANSWVIPATGHTLTETKAVTATCTEDGNVAGYTCSVCEKHFSDAAGEDEIEEAEWVIPATGHKITATEAKAATCTEDGNVAGYTCSVCGKHFKDEAAETEISDADWVVKATGHTEVKDAAVEPTEEKTGLTEGSHCSVCGAVLKAQEEIPKLDKKEDKEEEPEKEPEKDPEKEPEPEPHKHTEVKDEAVEPTCATNGLTEGSHCSDCDEVIVAQKTIPALGHWLGNWNPDDAGHHTAKCQRQGCTYADTFDCSLVDLPGEEGKDPVHFCPICGYCDGAEDGVRVEGLAVLEGEAKGSLCAFTVEPDGEHKYLVIAFDHYGHLMQQEGEITFAVPEELSEAGFVQVDEDGLVTLTIDFTPEEELPILFMILDV